MISNSKQVLHRIQTFLKSTMLDVLSINVNIAMLIHTNEILIAIIIRFFTTIPPFGYTQVYSKPIKLNSYKAS